MWAGLTFFVVMGLLIAVVVLLAGMSQTGTMMTKTTESTVGMRADMKQAMDHGQAFLEELKAHFPPNQSEITVAQILGIVENIHKITGKASTITPDQIGRIAEHVDSTLVSIKVMVDGFSSGEHTGTQLSATIGHIQELIANISPTMISDLATSINGLATHAGTLASEAEQGHVIAKVEEALVTLKEIGDRLKTLHEITVKI